MRNRLNVTFDLDRLVCHDEGDGWGNAEPYMWTVFFKIDGTTCRLGDDLFLEGTATIFTTPGSHGNLGDTDVDAGDTVNIPAAVGFQEMELVPIPVPEALVNLGVDDAPAIAGCIVILMEEDNVSDSGANSGHQALNNAVQNALNSLIPTLGVSNQTISDEDIEALTGSIQTQIENAIKDNQAWYENFWSWLNADDTIGTQVWKFSGDELKDNSPTTLHKRWESEGDWELFGSVTTEEIPSCPAEVVQAIIDALFGKSASEKSMKAMYEFRDQDMPKKYQGLNLWWQLARRNALQLKRALKDKEVADAASLLFRDVPELLKEREKPVSDQHFDAAIKVLTAILAENRTNRQTRKDIQRSVGALRLLKGKSPNQVFEFLSAVKPARYPQEKGQRIKPAADKKK